MTTASSAKRWDLVLLGPWERFVRVSSNDYVKLYKTALKQAFLGLRIYDPEDYQGPDWHLANFSAIADSRAAFVWVPEFPFPGCGPEAGMFFALNQPKGPLAPLKELVFLWPDQVRPAWGREVAARHGYVFGEMSGAIAHIGNIFGKTPA